MDVPEKQWFDEWNVLIKELEEGRPKLAFISWTANIDSVEKLKLVEEYVDGLIPYENAGYRKMDDSTLVTWLHGKGLTQTIRSMYRAGRRLNKGGGGDFDYRKWLTDKLMSDSYFSCRNRSFVKDSWITRFISAYQEYLFADHQAIYTARKNYAANVKKMEEAFSEMVPAFKDPDYVKSSFDRLMDKVVRSAPTESLRDSKLKAEHQFVRRMARLNRSYFGSPKPDKIADLMMLPGFRHQFDARHIGRLCSKLGVAKKG